jgi:hypothetical protein
MGNDRFWKNQDVKAKNRQEHFAARSALRSFRESGDPSGFLDLQRKVGGIHGFSLAGYMDNDVNPRLTQEEFDRFKAAFEATDEGKAYRQRLDNLFRDPLED